MFALHIYSKSIHKRERQIGWFVRGLIDFHLKTLTWSIHKFDERCVKHKSKKKETEKNNKSQNRLFEFESGCFYDKIFFFSCLPSLFANFGVDYTCAFRMFFFYKKKKWWAFHSFTHTVSLVCNEEGEGILCLLLFDDNFHPFVTGWQNFYFLCGVYI